MPSEDNLSNERCLSCEQLEKALEKVPEKFKETLIGELSLAWGVGNVNSVTMGLLADDLFSIPDLDAAGHELLSRKSIIKRDAAANVLRHLSYYLAKLESHDETGKNHT